MALEDFFEDFVILNKISEPDGQGGVNWYLIEGAPFRAGIRTVSSTEAEIAYRSGTKTIFRITTPLGVELEQNDIVLRRKDERQYRITGNAIDNTTPDVATLQYRYVTAEVMQ